MLIRRMQQFPKTAEEQLRAQGHRHGKKFNSCPRRPRNSSEHGSTADKRNIKLASTLDDRKQLRLRRGAIIEENASKGSSASHTAHYYTLGHKHIELNMQEHHNEKLEGIYQMVSLPGVEEYSRKRCGESAERIAGYRSLSRRGLIGKNGKMVIFTLSPPCENDIIMMGSTRRRRGLWNHPNRSPEQKYTDEIRSGTNLQKGYSQTSPWRQKPKVDQADYVFPKGKHTSVVV